jgi:hypothetical protein
MRPGARFQPGATRPAGHIFHIPAAERPTDETKTRPHFLVNRCDVASDPYGLATLAHMSTKATEHIEYGSPIHEIIDPAVLRKPDQDGNFVIASRLLPRDPERLTASGMSAVDEVRSVRRTVTLALGLGEGIAPPEEKSVRGRLVRILDERAGYPFGIVLTAHAYSAARRYQVIAPLLNAAVDGPDGPEMLETTRWDVELAPHPWWRTLALTRPMVDTAAVISLSEDWRHRSDRRRWLKRQIDVMQTSIDEATLAAVEARIAERLIR